MNSLEFTSLLSDRVVHVLLILAQLRITPVARVGEPHGGSGDRASRKIYDSEINIRIGWLWDGGIRKFRLGDDMNGYLAEETVRTVAEIVPWLQEAIAHFFPESTYAASLAPVVRERAAHRLFQPPRSGARRPSAHIAGPRHAAPAGIDELLAFICHRCGAPSRYRRRRFSNRVSRPLARGAHIGVKPRREPGGMDRRRTPFWPPCSSGVRITWTLRVAFRHSRPLDMPVRHDRFLALGKLMPSPLFPILEKFNCRRARGPETMGLRKGRGNISSPENSQHRCALPG